MEPACRQYRAARWFLLPEVGLHTRRQVVSGSLNGNRQTVKFFMCGTYSENGLAGPWEAVSGKSDAQPSVSKSARPGTPESELAD